MEELRGVLSEEAVEEVEAVLSVYEQQIEILATSHGLQLVYTPVGSACRATFEMTVCYPITSPLFYKIELLQSSVRNQRTLDVVTRDLQAIQIERVGERILFECIQAIQAFEETLDENLFDEGNNEKESCGTSQNVDNCSLEDNIEVVVIRIEHMNDSSKYVKTLSKWSESFSLTAHVIWRSSSDSKKRKRKEGIYVILRGEKENTKRFLTLLRTEKVDVDSRGVKCKEKKSTVVSCHAEDQILMNTSSAGLTIEDHPYTDISTFYMQLVKIFPKPEQLGISFSD